MIEIDRETGTVTWDDFRLYPQLSHDEFVERYPAIKCVGYSYKYSHIHSKQYQFPEISLNNYTLIPGISFTYDKLDGAMFDMLNVLYIETEANYDKKQLIDRSKSIREVLIQHLGQPHRVNPYCFGMIDTVLTTDETEALQAWEYDFEWGGAQTGCFFDQGGVVLMGLSVGYHPS